MREKIAALITQRWYIVLLFWILVAVGLRSISPPWDDVVQDGDFQFLPTDSPSRVGQATLRSVFPDDLARSQMVIVFAKPSGELTAADRCTMFDVARRLSFSVAEINLARWLSNPLVQDSTSASTQRLLHNLDTAVQFDERWFEAVRELQGEEHNSSIGSRRMIETYKARLKLAELIGNQELASSDLRTIEVLQKTRSEGVSGVTTIPTVLEPSIEEIWTWQDPVLAKNLGEDTPQIKLLALQLREEFMAVRNIELMESLQSIINDCRALTKTADSSSMTQAGQPEQMQIHITGPAAVGADLLTAAKVSVRQSEFYAILAVIVTLTLIYRSPLLIFLPLITIGVALSVSSNSLALIAGQNLQSEMTPWVELYSTTRVFLVVLIFGIGTDLTLFLIVRCRETYSASDELKLQWKQHIATSWSSVLEAIAGSGLTTTVGLSMMAFSAFAKFKYSGISISISLLITLAVCLTLPAAILSALGPIAYWPQRSRRNSEHASYADRRTVSSFSTRVWSVVADFITRRPTVTLFGTFIVLIVPAVHGFWMMDHVTYNLVGELGHSSTSRQGQSLITEFLPKTQTSSISLVVVAKEPFVDEAEFRKAIEDYRKRLFVDEVTSVQTLTDPLGDFPPDRNMSLFSQGAWRRRLLQNHPLTQQKFVSKVNEYALRAARFEIVMSVDPFSDQAARVLERVKEKAHQISLEPEAVWHESIATATGTTAGIIDLKATTQEDETRVQILVTLGVLCVLLLLTRRFELSLYLMFTVLFSYFVTLGVSQALFAWLYGSSYEGVDWKVPLFLFVILVAVGQDYNIYLTTRILEEQKQHGQRSGLHRAIVTTGGIITSCGLIMFATFASMCMGSVQSHIDGVLPNGWPSPSLRGIAELGFALSFGVLLDTFIIRTILVPAYIALRKLH